MVGMYNEEWFCVSFIYAHVQCLHVANHVLTATSCVNMFEGMMSLLL